MPRRSRTPGGVAHQPVPDPGHGAGRLPPAFPTRQGRRSSGTAAVGGGTCRGSRRPAQPTGRRRTPPNRTHLARSAPGACRPSGVLPETGQGSPRAAHPTRVTRTAGVQGASGAPARRRSAISAGSPACRGVRPADRCGAPACGHDAEVEARHRFCYEARRPLAFNSDMRDVRQRYFATSDR